jgi:hypothetical protein
MWWREDGRKYKRKALEKTPRPFLKPATDEAIRSGELHDVYWRHWLIAQQMVTT